MAEPQEAPPLTGPGAARPVDVAARAAVVVTCFNDGETLGESVASIMHASPGAELVVVDDGSTDPATLELLTQLAESGISVLRQSNQGLAAAAMAGVRATSAPYVMRFDADDILEPGALAALSAALDRAPSNACAAWGDVQTFGLTSFRIPGVPSLDPWLTARANCITGSGTLMRRSALLAVGGWQLSEGFEDWDVWMALAGGGFSGVYVPRVVFHYRRDRDGLLAGWRASASDHYDALLRRHPRPRARRTTLWRKSPVPLPARVLIGVIDRLAFLPRLTRITACELIARMFWSQNRSATWAMLGAGLSLRLGELGRSRTVGAHGG